MYKYTSKTHLKTDKQTNRERKRKRERDENTYRHTDRYTQSIQTICSLLYSFIIHLWTIFTNIIFTKKSLLIKIKRQGKTSTKVM